MKKIPFIFMIFALMITNLIFSMDLTLSEDAEKFLYFTNSLEQNPKTSLKQDQKTDDEKILDFVGQEIGRVESQIKKRKRDKEEERKKAAEIKQHKMQKKYTPFEIQKNLLTTPQILKIIKHIQSMWNSDYKDNTLPFLAMNQHIKDNNGRTLLHYLAAHNHHEILEAYLNNQEEKKAVIDSQDNDCYTLLHYAALNGHLELMKFLIVYGADVQLAIHDGSTPYELTHKTTNENNRSELNANLIPKKCADLKACREYLVSRTKTSSLF